MNDHELAIDLARRAGELLMSIRAGFTGEAGDSALGDLGDRAANELLLEGLATARPDDAVLSEESADDPARLDASRVWIIDPLDGTREFREGRDDWAVHVALSVDGRPEVGAVALPSLDRGEALDATQRCALGHRSRNHDRVIGGGRAIAIHVHTSSTSTTLVFWSWARRRSG